MAEVEADAEGLLGGCGCSSGAPPTRASAAPVSSLLWPGSSGAAVARILAPPPAASLPDWLAAAFWGSASSSTLSNGLGAPALDRCRSRRGAGGGATGRCIQGPGWMMVSQGWLSLRLEPELPTKEKRFLHTDGIRCSRHRFVFGAEEAANLRCERAEQLHWLADFSAYRREKTNIQEGLLHEGREKEAELNIDTEKQTTDS